MVEIGPGLGALTEPVCELIDNLTVVELDRDLVERLSTHPFLSPKLNIVQSDALKFDFSQLADDKNPLRIFGNLPYNISTPLMFHLFSYATVVHDMHFMLQREVVNRLAASPGNKDYGRLSVMAQYHCQVIPVLEVPPSAFKPAPKVDSAIVRLLPYTDKPIKVEDVEKLQQVCKLAFNQRRKTIRNSLRTLLCDEDLAKAGVNPDLRAENLSLSDYAALANAIT